MKRGILLALLVSSVVFQADGWAAPRKRGKAGKKATTATTPEPTPTPTDPPPAPASGTGSAAPTATPAPAPSTTPATPATPAGGTATAPAAPEADKPASSDDKGPDVDTLRQEYLSLRDELFKSRARANAVASQLYSTRMTVKFTWGSGRYYGVSKASIRLDGAVVYEDASGAIAGDDGVRFDGYIAPGRHLVTFRVEATGKDDDSFTSATESQVVIKAVAGKDLVVAAKGKDDGDIAYAWKRSEKGNYGLGIDVSVKAVGTGAAKAGKK